MRKVGWLVAGLGLALAAAGGCDTGSEDIICEGKVVGNRCTFPEQPDTAAPPADTAAPPADTAAPPDTATAPDTGPDPEWSCLQAAQRVKPMGYACERHCECQTGYCYDEAYLGGFRFCTRDCAGSCESEGSEGGLQQFRCLLLGGELAKKYGLTRTSICQRVCDSLDDCKELGSAYDTCGLPCPTGKPATCWEGHRLADQPTCQIAAEAQ